VFTHVEKANGWLPGLNVGAVDFAIPRTPRPPSHDGSRAVSLRRRAVKPFEHPGRITPPLRGSPIRWGAPGALWALLEEADAPVGFQDRPLHVAEVGDLVEACLCCELGVCDPLAAVLPDGVVRVPYRIRRGEVWNAKLHAPGRRGSWWERSGVAMLPFGLERLAVRDAAVE
jgi:hypothetical protein